MRANKHLAAVMLLGSVAYPLLVYVFSGRVASYWFLSLPLAFAALRLAQFRRHIGGWPVAALGVLLFAGALLAVHQADAAFAVKAYPVLVSLTVCAAFSYSLYAPPSVVERIARLRTPQLPPEAVRYTRRVTAVWAGFTFANALICAGLAAYGSLAAWTLWTGALSYLLMGTLFAGEYLLRRRLLHHAETPCS